MCYAIYSHNKPNINNYHHGLTASSLGSDHGPGTV